MSFNSMINEILGIPGMNRGLAATKINEAFQLIQDERVWSFQLVTGGWLTPGLLGGYTDTFLSPGNITVQSYTNTIVGDAVATAAWAAASKPFITSYQIRVPYYSLYNIIGYTPGAGLPYNFVLQQAVPSYPTALILADTATGNHYSISFSSGAFQFTNIGGAGTPVAGPVFLDQTTGLNWKLSVTNGSLNTTVVSGSAITQYVLKDTVTGYEGLMVVGGALEWEELFFPVINYSFSVVNGSFEYMNIGSTGTPIPNPVFQDTVTGLYWQISVVGGSLVETQITSPSTFILSYPVADVTTAASYSFQFTSGSFGVVPTGLSNFASLTLDRPWMEPSQVNSGYMAYGAYFPAPAGLKKWLAIRDTTNNQPMDWYTYTQVDLSEVDPQRTDFAQPQYVVPYGPDTRQGSATYGQMLYELWQHPLTQLPYTYQCEASWPALVNMTDTLPYPLTEELVKFRTYEVISLWKEMQKGEDMERGSGTNWQFLAKAYREEYESRLKKIALVDRQLCDLYFTRMNRFVGHLDSFVSVNGQMSVGA
ncbi:unnamed protein product [Sphagnum jensenii]